MSTTESMSFDGFTTLYDQTRSFDPICFGRSLDWLATRFPPRQFRSVLEPGVGTGRIVLPLAGRGYQVTGLDISEEMLGVCVAQSQSMGTGGVLHCLRADATRLPLSSGVFDLCVAVHLFYFIPDWRGAVREMLRALRPGGALILLHTGNGAEVPRLNEHYRELAQALGYTFPTYGVRSTRDVVDYAASLGCAVERAEKPSWEWTTQVSARKALSHLRARAYSFTKDVPEDVHGAVMDRLQRESLEGAAGPDSAIHVPNRISIVIVSPPDQTNEGNTQLGQRDIPEFGDRKPDEVYVPRPGAYGLILNGEGRIAVMQTPRGDFLPGGGTEGDESPEETLVREVREECGFSVEIIERLGEAAEYRSTAGHEFSIRKECVFFAATVGDECGATTEANHTLIWLEPHEVERRLAHGSQRWAVRQFRPTS